MRIPSAGITLKFKSLVFEYGYEAHPYLDPTYRYSISLQLSPAVVSINSATINHNPIFRSLHRYPRVALSVGFEIGRAHV